MMNQETLQGNWNEIKGKVRSKWGSLTEDDLKVFNGNVDQLIGTIQRKTGEGRESIEKFFDSLSADGASAISRASEAVRTYAQQAAETMQQSSKQATESVMESYHEVEDMVRQRPAESLAVCFGVGVITGVVISMLFRGR